MSHPPLMSRLHSICMSIPVAFPYQAGQPHPVWRSWLPYAVAVATAALAVGAMLLWSTSAADRLSFERQHRLANILIEQSVATVAHDQEGFTVWDDSVRQLARSSHDLEWLDNNLGIWVHDYYGHDATYVLDPNDRPVYAMIDGRRARPADFERVAGSALPLARDLRARLRSGVPEQLPSNILSPGATDIAVVNGHPAIVGVKPVRSDSGTIEQQPGSEYFHVSVRRLDGTFLDTARTGYGFAGVRFAWTREGLDRDERAVPLRTRGGRTVGYLVWEPFAPGSTVFARLIWPLVAGFLILGVLISLLVGRVMRRTDQLRESRATAQHLAFHDTLTGLPNRALFDDRLDHALRVFRSTAEHRLALIYLDLDRFKKVNDTLGHPAGDELIRQFAARLKMIVRVNDTAARLGGDEFAIIQTDVSSLADTECLCARIIEAGSEPFVIGGSQIYVGVSVGVALAGKDGLKPGELIRKADIALYQAKAQGRGIFRLFTPTMDEPIRAREATERDLRSALQSGDQLSVVYQPLYASETKELTGVEALVRWDHPQTGPIPPATFIPIAEEMGLIEPLGEWVLAEACRAARDWPVTVSVNVSAVQLRNPHFANRVLGIISEEGMSPERLELEITETALLEHAPEVTTNLRFLRSFGVRVALDDFGTGYSSFSHLREFEVDRVKIDRTFVDKIDTDQGGSAIIRAIVDLARSSGLQTTAEGVETDEQRDFLTTIGCNDLQGYLMSRPVPRQQMDDLLGKLADVTERPQVPVPARQRRRTGS
jgi:diguanylate cyclase (GGDEF)-like protein